MVEKELEDGIGAKIWENELQEGQLAVVEWGTQVTMTVEGARKLRGFLNENKELLEEDSDE